MLYTNEYILCYSYTTIKIINLIKRCILNKLMDEFINFYIKSIKIFWVNLSKLQICRSVIG